MFDSVEPKLAETGKVNCAEARGDGKSERERAH
jgi:hypothetical protein